MVLNVRTPWHKASFEKFLNERLPELLAARLPLAGYQATETGAYTCRVMITLAAASGDVEIAYDALPQPDETGVFQINDELKVVLPVAEHERLESAAIHCVGERLFDFIAERLGQAPPDLPWDATLARAWLPLDAWIADFMRDVAQPLETTNWLAQHTHLRSFLIADCTEVIAPEQRGRACPFETPEGPNIGRVLRVAVGAEIRDGALVVVDACPAAGLGLSGSMIPFLEHDDPNRLLMGANMLRQWIPQAMLEPALVQTGNEPDAAWAGRNLLTAYVSWGVGTFEDGIVISESCAQRFDTPYPLQIGDKLSNRHGTKSVVAQILPDAAMPHLLDGTPVELAFNFASLHRRMNFGQVREAVMGRIAHAEGEPATVPPFAAPDEATLCARLAAAGLPESGMETLALEKDGPALEQPSTVGWVYWGRLIHLAQDKLHTYMDGRLGQVQGEMENYTLRDIGAFEAIREALNTRSVRRADAETLTARVAAGPVEQPEPPTPLFCDLACRLRVAGIEAVLTEAPSSSVTSGQRSAVGGQASEAVLTKERLSLHFAPPDETALKLARSVPHPWLRERLLTEIGRPDFSGASDAGLSGLYAAVVEANDRLARMLVGPTPPKLVEDAAAHLESRVQAFFAALLTLAHLRLSERQTFSGRAVLTPGAGLTLDQVGLPDAMAWALFAPLVTRALGGDADAVAARSDRAVEALDAVMARSWVIVNRAPTVAPTALLAFHPMRVPDAALHLHPLLCEWLNADFDGDQAAVFLPVTEAAQREAGEKLSVAGHLRRDPALLATLLPRLDALWGLAALSQRPGGLDEVSQLAGVPVAAPGGFVTRPALLDALRVTLAQEDVDAVLSRLERLTARGFEVAQASGASLAPFFNAAALVSPPASNAPEAWNAYVAEVAEALHAPTDCAPAGMGPQCLMMRASGVGAEQLAWIIGGRGVIKDLQGETVIVRHGYSDGYTPEELFACVAGARRGLAQVMREWEQMGQTFRERNVARSFHVLARALRAQNPGVVFARAADLGESDPLTDVDSRLLVGLPV